MTEHQKKWLIRRGVLLVVAILGAVVWPQFIALALIGSVLFAVSLARFRKTIGMMA